MSASVSRDELENVLTDVVLQACTTDTAGEYDSMAMTAYARGLLVLERLGRVRITAQCGRRIIAEDVTRASDAD